MKPAPLDLPVIWRGCDYAPIIFKWKDKNGNPFNLSGWTPNVQTREFPFNVAISDIAGGVTQIWLTNEQTAPLKLGKKSWDWLWENENADSILPPLLAGCVVVQEPVTKP